MRFILFVLLFWQSVFAGAADFDCIVVGTSPFTLFEALYRCHSGNRVLILEEAAECGGAWKAINICGIPHADLGCHQIGHDVQLKAFLETYAGCHIVSMDNPLHPFEPSNSPNGFYFSQGCYELIDHLTRLIQATNIVLLLNHKVESVSVDPKQKIATVKTKNRWFTTSKVIVTPMSGIHIENSSAAPHAGSKSKYYHLYLLIQDPTPPRFTYNGGGVAPGISRIMNLTHFVGLANSGRQLLVFQTHNDQNLTNGQTFLDALKSRNLVDKSAYILKNEPCIYESSYFNQSLINQMNAGEFFEILNTGHFQNLTTYISKWKQVLKPYKEIIK